MSNNNRNRNRSNQKRPQPNNGPVQDRVFVFRSRTGSEIRIPASTTFDPDVSAAIDLADAQESGEELRAAAALINFIQSGFDDEIAETINLKVSELEEFTGRFFSFFGISIPK